jgi:hypothetical protein
MTQETNICDWDSRPMTCHPAGLNTKAHGLWAVVPGPTVGDVEIFALRPRMNAGRWRERTLLLGKTRAYLFCLKAVVLPTLRPGWMNPRRWGAAN